MTIELSKSELEKSSTIEKLVSELKYEQMRNKKLKQQVNQCKIN